MPFFRRPNRETGIFVQEKFMHRVTILRASAAACFLALVLPSFLHPQDRDTVYQIAPVVVTPTQASGRNSPVTFTNIPREQIARDASDRDVPVLLSGLPSMTFYSENGN